MILATATAFGQMSERTTLTFGQYFFIDNPKHPLP
ncbi:hypothetical protein CP8484711_1556, partial [Chlamydia psittaci 84-8471/1]